MKKIKITLAKGLSGRKPRQIRTIKALGLGKRGSSVVKEATDSIRGMVAKINHLVTVEEVK